MFFFIGNKKIDKIGLNFKNSLIIIKLDTLLKDVYEKSKDIDGFLYIEFTDVEAFG